MLEQHEVTAYLLQRRLLRPRSIVTGRLRIDDASSRNRNFRVSGGPGESYLLKQGIVADSAETLENEVALYRRLAAPAQPLAGCVPRLYGYDEERGVLILEWIADGQDLYRHHGARNRCSRTLSAALGRVLAVLHGVAPDGEELRDDAPWVLSLHRPALAALKYLSAASIELIRVIQADDRFAAALDELREDWSVEALVHRDVKWANCIAHPADGGARPTRVKLVDWEMAGWGDPGFDVGSAFSDFLGDWLRSVHDVERATRPLHAMHPAIVAFWRAYVDARGLDDAAASRLLVRSVRHAAARLVQSAYEDTQEAPRMSARVTHSVRLSRDILLAPREAASDLLGLAP